MDDFKEQEPWDENEVQIEDLGAPNKGFSLFLFSCGKKLQAAARSRLVPVALVSIVCLLALLLLPGSTLLSPVAPPASSNSLQYIEVTGCYEITIVPTDVTTWLRQAAPGAPGEVIIYNCSTPQGAGGKPRVPGSAH